MSARIGKDLSQHLNRGLTWPVGVAGALVLGLSGTAIAAPPANQPEPLQPMLSTSGAALDSPVALSFNVGELFQNVFQYIQVSTISDDEEIAIGRQVNDMLLSQEYRLYNSNQVQQYVEQLGQRLVNASDSRDIPFTFQVVSSDEVNAFAVPGGFVYVTTGLLQEADNEAQLASVLAHEISHINQRHSVEAMKQAVLAQGIAETAGVDTSTLAQIGYQLAVNLPRSREFEYSADEGGLRILRAAGYPPQAFINFLEQLMGGSGQPEFLRTHPTSANRIEEIRTQLSADGTASSQGMNEAAYENSTAPLN